MEFYEKGNVKMSFDKDDILELRRRALRKDFSRMNDRQQQAVFPPAPRQDGVEQKNRRKEKEQKNREDTGKPCQHNI